jgi:outer membrane protein OmpA-like peptidoglycan-associated protein
MSGTRYVVLALCIAACHHDKKAPTVPVAKAPPQQEAPKQTAQQDVPISNNLNASDDLVKQCQLKFDNQDRAPKFEYDQAALTSVDRDVLDQIAQCLTQGPLKGRAVQLVGRADPRGTEEYNLGLGDRRAREVASYLQRLGVATGKIKEMTRGALDASGRDEPGWRVDRRVDVELN